MVFFPKSFLQKKNAETKSQVKKAEKAIINLKNRKLRIKKIQNPFKQKNLVKKIIHPIFL